MSFNNLYHILLVALTSIPPFFVENEQWSPHYIWKTNIQYMEFIAIFNLKIVKNNWLFVFQVYR
mgnify:CR=1 FL=1